MEEAGKYDTVSFSRVVASDCGITAAIIFQFIANWIRFNANTNRNEHGGRYWMYMSYADIEKSIGLFDTRTIARSIARLVELHYLDTGCFNDRGFDRTTWYAIGSHLDKVSSSIMTKCPDATRQNVTTNTNIVNNNINKGAVKGGAADENVVPKRIEIDTGQEPDRRIIPWFNEFWEAYPRKTFKERACSEFVLCLKKITREKREAFVGAFKAGFRAWLESADWKDENGRFVPIAANFIARRKWEVKPNNFNKEESNGNGRRVKRADNYIEAKASYKFS